ncbi:Spy/CpxP family protein refolding chaperone [Thiomonas sp. FB-Cd]|uniref:Spy/CpxP family protein refolding chaperone n=1 Tax=Thiomonas sp. FB-Cd TaxID=1158292 RepID=UPI000AC39651|nr:Spy/CpxP family protein refolding chaperone [Thiomonas sp. FB-Cd]
MNKQTMRALVAAPALSLALAAGGFVATHAAEPASSAAPSYGPGYGMGPGMMGGYGPWGNAPGGGGYASGAGYHRGGPGGYGPGSSARGFGYGAPWMMGGGYGGFGMGPWMMGGGYGGYGMGPWMMGGGYGGYGMWGHGAGAALGLTDAQQQKIAAIEDAQFKKQWALMPQMHAAMLASSRNFEAGKIDVDAAMKSAKAMEDLRLQMLRNHLEAVKQIDAVLTPEQRAKLQQGRPWRSQ